MKNNKKKVISIIWGYSKHMYNFSPEENYHIHFLKVAKDLGYEPYAIVKNSADNMKMDPNFDPAITVLDYKNPFYFFYQIVKFSLQGSLFYVNSYEWQSFAIPFIARKTIFMAHTQPKRQTRMKQNIQNFVYRFFTAIRLNNETEKEFLIKEKTPLKKLFVVPLVISDIFKITNTTTPRKDLVYFGNVTGKKNLITILKAFERVKQTYKDMKMNVIGNIWDQNTENFINGMQYKKDVIIHGFLPNDVLVERLNQTLIYTNSSTDEGQCVAVYDAAMCGNALCLPTIMSFTGVFKDKALFHDIYDHKKLAENILYYLKNPDIIEKYKNENIEMIRKEYSKETVEQKIKHLLTQCETP